MAEVPVYTEVNAAVIERCKKGERKAFHELYMLYAKAMFNVALRIVNSAAEAEEVLQDSFLKAFEKIGSYDADYAFGAWLKRIVINRSLDALKKRKLVFVPLDEVRYEQDEPNEDEPVLDVETVKSCVAELPDGYRTILSLFVFEDYSHRDIAGLLGISEGTSKSQYNRAKKKLMELVRQKLKRDE